MKKFNDTYKQYLKQGVSTIPLNPGQKTPLHGLKWNDDESIKQAIKNAPDNANIGIILGDKSRGLVDIDCDIKEAEIAAAEIFPDAAVFGRKSTPQSHRIIICNDAGKTKQFELSESEANLLGLQNEKLTIIEVRSNGGYTMAPPSIHPSGEQLKWCGNIGKKLPVYQYEDVVQKVKLCAFIAVIMRAYPNTSGSRNKICMALAGTLLRAELPVDQVNNIIKLIASYNEDEEAEKRCNAEATKLRLDAKEKITGLNILCELLNIRELMPKLRSWLYGEKSVSELDAAVEKLNERFFVIENEGGKCLIGSFEKHIFEKCQTREVLSTQSFTDFRNRFMNKMVVIGFDDEGKPKHQPLGKLWLEHWNRRQYEKVVFNPGNISLPNTYNLWKGFAYTPSKNSWKRMIKHIWRVLSKRDRANFRYIIMWAAWSVQNPDSPAEVALVFRGGKGTGKGTFCRWLKNIFGQHGLQIFSPAHLTGRFNGHLRDCVLLFADEAIAPNDRKAEATLKGMLTEPSIPIEGKGKDIIQVPNHLHVVMASNSEQVIAASADERRFAVFDISDDEVGNKDYFKLLNIEMESGGAEGMLYFLQNLKLNDWHPRTDIPSNKALNDQRIHSLKGYDRVYFDWLYAGDTQFSEDKDRIFVATTDFAELIQNGNATSAGRYLNEMGCEKARNIRPSGYILPDLKTAREIWDKKRFPVDWDDAKNWNSLIQPPNKTVF